MQSVTTVVAGIYVLLRFAFLLDTAPAALELLIATGSATMLLASLSAATQLDLSRLLALTTSSVMGLVLVGIGVGAYSTAAFLLLTHGFVKALLLLASGVVLTTLKGESDLRKMGGLSQRMRWTQGVFGLGALALVGFPPFANFFPIEELLAFLWISERPDSDLVLMVAIASLGILAFALGRAFFLIFWGNVRPGGLLERQLNDPAGWRQHSLTALAVMAVLAGLLTPSQFWAELFGAPTEQMDSIGFFLTSSIPGAPDPELLGFERGTLIGLMSVSVLIGVLASGIRYARRGYRGEPKHPVLRGTIEAMREMLYIERGYLLLLVRPLRRLSQFALVRGIETQLIDRVVVSGGSGLGRQIVWNLFRRLQNGRLQSYTLLGLLTVLVVVSWMVV